jgi:hypothetical protein
MSMIIKHRHGCERNRANGKMIDATTTSSELHKLQIYFMPVLSSAYSLWLFFGARIGPVAFCNLG